MPATVLAILLNWLLGMLVEAVSTTVSTMGVAPPVHALCSTARITQSAWDGCPKASMARSSFGDQGLACSHLLLLQQDAWIHCLDMQP